MKQKYEGEDLLSLVELGREQGYLTFDQVNDFLPQGVSSPIDLRSTLGSFQDMDIKILADLPADGTEAEVKEVLILLDLCETWHERISPSLAGFDFRKRWRLVSQLRLEKKEARCEQFGSTMEVKFRTRTTGPAWARIPNNLSQSRCPAVGKRGRP
jgi:hypothetical protein